MTINEIEATLHTLEGRHPDLTEEKLLTLLRASGWEEKVIQEAVVIFKTTRALGTGTPRVTKSEDKPEPKKEETKNTQVNIPPIQTTTPSAEPQSLVTNNKTDSTQTKKVEPPENLPLKPFESADHVWPLSRYNEVFHGDVPPILSRAESKLVDEHNGKKEDEHEEKIIKLKRTPFDGEDEGLIILTGISLFIVLLLLAYMYSNGRL